LRDARALLANSEKALELFPCDFREWDRNAAEGRIKWKGVQRALSTLTHAHRWESLHDELLARGERGGRPTGVPGDEDEEPPVVVADNRTAAQLEARAGAASLLSSGGGEAMLWLEHRRNYGTANLTPVEFRLAFRFSFEIPEPVLTKAAESRSPCGCGARDCGGKVFSTGMQYVYHVLNRTSDTGGGSAYQRHNAINNAVHALAESAKVTARVGGLPSIVPRKKGGERTLPGIEMGGRMDPEFHEVLYRLARADADSVIGPLAEGEDAFRVAEHRMHLKRVKHRMIAAIQPTRVKWAVWCINSACPREQQAGRAVRVEEAVF
jgi:hypothetical protein